MSFLRKIVKIIFVIFELTFTFANTNIKFSCGEGEMLKEIIITPATLTDIQLIKPLIQELIETTYYIPEGQWLQLNL